VADGQQFGYDLAFVGSFFTGAGEEAEAGQGAKLLQRAAKGCFGECFVAGTLVQMADGSMRPISQVQVGDQVLSRDPATGKDEAKTVTNTIERHAPSVVDVVLHDAKTGHDETLTCTPEHPLFVEGQGWVEAGSLGIGSSIVSRAGPAMKVTGLTWQKNKAQELTAGSSGSSFGGYTVYNLTVEGDHTFFVGTTGGGTWVHNVCAADFSEDQNALVALAKAAKKGKIPGISGISRKEAQTLLDWAKEYGVGNGGKIEQHANRPLAQFPHIRIGPINHIWVWP